MKITAKATTGRPDGIWIQHATARSQVALVVVPSRPYLLSAGSRGVCDGKDGRPLIPAPITDCECGVVHTHKTVHLWVDDAGRCLVSDGVLDLLEQVGLESCGLSVIGHTPTPPTVKLGVARERVDFENRKYQPLTPIVAEKKLTVMKAKSVSGALIVDDPPSQHLVGHGPGALIRKGN